MALYLRQSLLALSVLLIAAPEASALQYGTVESSPPLTSITATGPIVPGDFDRLDAFIAKLPKTELLFFIDSPGGNIFEAEKIATFINKSGATVTIPSDSQCASACFLLFAAAAHRFMGPNALIGVHSASENGEENLTSMGITTALARDVAAYGVPDSIIGKLVQTEPGRMTWLTPTDLKPMGVAVLPESSPQARPLPTAIPQPPKTTLEPAKVVYVVNVGSKRTQEEVLAAFADMQRHYPSLLAGYRPMVQKADLGARGIWYRMRIGPMYEKHEAIKLCSELMLLGLPDCLVTTY